MYRYTWNVLGKKSNSSDDHLLLSNDSNWKLISRRRKVLRTQIKLFPRRNFIKTTIENIENVFPQVNTESEFNYDADDEEDSSSSISREADAVRSMLKLTSKLNSRIIINHFHR